MAQTSGHVGLRGSCRVGDRFRFLPGGGPPVHLQGGAERAFSLRRAADTLGRCAKFWKRGNPCSCRGRNSAAFKSGKYLQGVGEPLRPPQGTVNFLSATSHEGRARRTRGRFPSWPRSVVAPKPSTRSGPGNEAEWGSDPAISRWAARPFTTSASSSPGRLRRASSKAYRLGANRLVGTCAKCGAGPSPREGADRSLVAPGPRRRQHERDPKHCWSAYRSNGRSLTTARQVRPPASTEF